MLEYWVEAGIIKEISDNIGLQLFFYQFAGNIDQVRASFDTFIACVIDEIGKQRLLLQVLMQFLVVFERSQLIIMTI